MLQELDDKVIWVTGATSGIGEAATILLSQGGATVIASGRRADRLDALADQLIEPFHLAPLDVADEEAVNECAQQIIETYGRIDVLVHSAGLNSLSAAGIKLVRAAGMKSFRSISTVLFTVTTRYLALCANRAMASLSIFLIGLADSSVVYQAALIPQPNTVSMP